MAHSCVSYATIAIVSTFQVMMGCDVASPKLSDAIVTIVESGATFLYEGNCNVASFNALDFVVAATLPLDLKEERKLF